MKKVSVIAAAVAATLAAGSAFAVDFNGYMRAGTGISAESGGDVSFMKNGIGRLGNEDDNYSEFGFAEDLKTGDQTWRLESMIASGVQGAKGWEDGDFNVAQFAVKAKGLIASDKDATLWAGKTYYQRKDIHITDFYFLNTSGTGGGIENLSVGNQKLSLAIIQDGEDENGAGYIADARLANIGLWEDASLEVALAYNFSTESKNGKYDGDDGLLASGIIHQNMSNGFNQTVVQVGTAGYGIQMANFWGAGTYYDRSGDQNDGFGYRVINWGVMNLGENWEMGHQLAYLAGSDLGTTKYDSSQYSIVARPMYKWNDTMRTIFEAGYNAGEVDDVDFGGAKFTVAQAWAMGDSFWARPEIRVYGSYLMDLENDSFGEVKNDAGVVTAAGTDNDFVVGIQVEAWW
ncbi:maltoporin LamB [Vibrio parahaemolyticus]|uniref:maltoporin LamB n=1 Tax=Vibrio parahaemolyticus TaxID=670 RepID=UPI0006A73AEB|nr:maltoporin LamB [Vibrio parahaemolyticus]EGR0213790.1 maltoporin LamB [Vibrio parahaemolyticus]KON57350.1 maltoporin [Vibrio parahaemolyticus]